MGDFDGDTYGNKALIEIDVKPMFVELAILYTSAYMSGTDVARMNGSFTLGASGAGTSLPDPRRFRR